MNLTDALQKYFGYTNFRPGQEIIIQSILSNQDVLGVLPTGGGKSICYQLPALLMNGITVVISPLISLMKDQVDSLQREGIAAGYINSSMDRQAYLDTITAMRRGQLKLIYVAPERLLNDWFSKELSQQNISMIAVDEAHCVSQWGHDFRQSYRNINQYIQQLTPRPIITAFTATATEVVRDDIIQQLELQSPQVFINSFDRPNIRFTIKEPTNKMEALTEYLSHDESIIIYSGTRNNCEKLELALSKRGYKVGKYHAGMSAEARQTAQDNFIYDRINIIVATNAFGMGIDKTDVRKVIHYNMPTDLESYYQEAGRAGRDSLEAEAILLFSAQDIVQAKLLIENSQDPYVEKRLQTMVSYVNETRCLRNYILRYFGEATHKPCQNCSSCLSEFETIDVTKEAQMILSCIVRMKQAFGMMMVTNVLRGSKDKKIREWGFDKLSTYGLLKDYPQGEVRDIISSLLASNYLKVNEHRGLELTHHASNILKGETTFKIKARKRKKAVHKPKISAALTPTDNELFESLRHLRSELAKEEGVPAYIIFNNKSLVDMTYQLPTDYNSFLKIEGVGAVKADKYWKDFTDIIKTHLNS